MRYFTKKLKYSKTLSQELSYAEVCFTDQNSKRTEIEDKINITLVVNERRSTTLN